MPRSTCKTCQWTRHPKDFPNSAIAILYEEAKQEEALSKIEKALEWRSNGPQGVLWLKFMKGVLQAELGHSGALESFKELEPANGSAPSDSLPSSIA